jgi:uncharacterized membrane protein
MDPACTLPTRKDSVIYPAKRIAELAVIELIAEQLPFTRNRLDAAPLTSRIASGAICRAALYGADGDQSLQERLWVHLGHLRAASQNATCARELIATSPT